MECIWHVSSFVTAYKKQPNTKISVIFLLALIHFVWTILTLRARHFHSSSRLSPLTATPLTNLLNTLYTPCNSIVGQNKCLEVKPISSNNAECILLVSLNFLITLKTDPNIDSFSLHSRVTQLGVLSETVRHDQRLNTRQKLKLICVTAHTRSRPVSGTVQCSDANALFPRSRIMSVQTTTLRD